MLDLSVIGPKGAMLYEVLPAIAQCTEDDFLETTSPFLIQVPVDGGPDALERLKMPGGARSTDKLMNLAPDATTSMSVNDLKALRRDKSAKDVRLHRVVARNEGTTVVLGRDDDCDVILPSSTVSKKHAELRQSLGNWMLKDLGSANGTFINGTQVPSGEAAKVENKNNLWFSSYQCVFLLPEQLFSLAKRIAKKK